MKRVMNIKIFSGGVRHTAACLHFRRDSTETDLHGGDAPFSLYRTHSDALSRRRAALPLDGSV